VNVAWFGVPPLSVPVPRVVVPSMNVTVPVAAALSTVAVNVTDWPYADGFGADTSVVVVAFLFTTCVTVFDVAVVKFASPLYVAVMSCEPAVSVDVVNVAVFGEPPLSEPVPRVVVPSMNVTVPVAFMVLSVAVKVTESPTLDGFREDVSVTVGVA